MQAYPSNKKRLARDNSDNKDKKNSNNKSEPYSITLDILHNVATYCIEDVRQTYCIEAVSREVL